MISNDRTDLVRENRKLIHVATLRSVVIPNEPDLIAFERMEREWVGQQARDGTQGSVCRRTAVRALFLERRKPDAVVCCAQQLLALAVHGEHQCFGLCLRQVRQAG